MNIKTFESIEEKPGLTKFETALLDYNSVDMSKLPDIGRDVSLADYLSEMKPISKAKEFVDMVKANHGKKFFVIGDYDCDGIFATVIMAMALSACGEQTDFTAPDRFIDGYGMKNAHVDMAVKSGAGVIVTVDNGITALDEIDYAKSKGLKVIVTDHHIRQGENHADLIIDPWVNDDEYKDISGATVAFKLSVALQKEFGFGMDMLEKFMCLAGITSFSDVMTMIGENRLLAKAMIQRMGSDCQTEGTFANRISYMLDYFVPGSTRFRSFDKDNLDFYFIPIVNAANRVIGNVNALIYDIMILFSHDYDGYPHVYRDMNKERKYMRTELLRLHKPDPDSKAVVEVICPGSLDNYSGITGLVASDVVDSEGKPALIGIPSGDGTAKFSGRSVRGYNLYEALGRIKSSHPEMTMRFGGHAEALGMSCKESEAKDIQSLLSSDFEKSGIKAKADEEYFDAGGSILDVLAAYSKFSPFGPGFSFPRFYSEGSLLGCDAKNRTFSVSSLGRPYGIAVYGKADFDSILRKASSRSDGTPLRFSYSAMSDPNGESCLKLDKFFK